MRFAVLIVAVLAVCVHADVAADLITNLPGWTGPTPSRQYSGYLQISDTKFIHYWFVESYAANQKSAPVALWLNGGPGCSSLDGFIYEHGPFRINPNNGSLMLNPYTWVNVANMLYIEAPVGVGFSYSNNLADLNCTDDTTAQDNLKSVEKFFYLYPEYKNNDFFITGESYGGVYVPTLAEAIMWATDNRTYTGAPLKGIAVGNGCTGTEIGTCGPYRDKYDTLYLTTTTALIPQKLKLQITAACGQWTAPNPSQQCMNLVQQMANGIGDVNLYNMYGLCINGDSEEAKAQRAQKFHHKAPIHKTRFFSPEVGGPDACIDSILASDYFNQPAVWAAIHVRNPGYRWWICGQQPGWDYTSTRPNLPRDTYPALIQRYYVVIYNGDWDACVPYTDNEEWTTNMGYGVASPWHVWTYLNGTQVGGYATRYDANDFTFITVKGGRHEVPETAPQQALEMFTRVINFKRF